MADYPRPHVPCPRPLTAEDVLRIIDERLANGVHRKQDFEWDQREYRASLLRELGVLYRDLTPFVDERIESAFRAGWESGFDRGHSRGRDVERIARAEGRP